jgi:hypothetical protein
MQTFQREGPVEVRHGHSNTMACREISGRFNRRFGPDDLEPEFEICHLLP